MSWTAGPVASSNLCSFVLNRGASACARCKSSPTGHACDGAGHDKIFAQLQLERRITVAAVVLPFLGFIAAIWLLWGGAVTGLDPRSSP